MNIFNILYFILFIILGVYSKHYSDAPIFNKDICKNLIQIRSKEIQLDVAVDLYPADSTIRFIGRFRKILPSIEEIYIWCKDPYAFKIITLKITITTLIFLLLMIILSLFPYTKPTASRGFVIAIWLFAYLIQFLLSIIVFIFTQLKKLVMFVVTIVTFDRIMGLIGSNKQTVGKKQM